MGMETMGILTAMFGVVIGFVGTGYGVHASMANADTPARKEFVRKVGFYGVSALFVLLFAVVLSANGMLPNWVFMGALMIWFLLLGPAILLINRAYARMAPDQASAS